MHNGRATKGFEMRFASAISIACRIGLGLALLVASLIALAGEIAQCGACSTSFECAEGLSCNGARCRGDPAQCCRDEECALGQTCQQHQCRAAPTGFSQCASCDTSFQCGEGMTCVGARCRAKNDDCCRDQDCPSGQSCQDHRCKATAANVGQCGACSTSFECGSELRCIGARCRNDDQCCLAQDCPTGQTCVNHQCQ